MTDQFLDIEPGQLTLDSSFAMDVRHSTWSAPIELFDEPETIEQIALSFDQLGRPIVFYRVLGNQLKLRWYDSLAGQNVTTLIGYGTDPKAAFDYPTDQSAGFSDVLLHYVRKNRLFMRVQRDRFLIEYPVHPGQAETVARLTFNGNFNDLTGQPWIVSGDVAIVQSGFFGEAARFAGGGLTATDTDDWAFGTGDFTIGFRLFPEWVFDSTTTAYFICGNWSTFNGGTGWGVYLQKTGKIEVRLNASTVVYNTAVFTDGLWGTIEITREAGTVYILSGGVLVHQISMATDLTTTRPIKLGMDHDLTATAQFIMDGFYVIKGVAQHNSDYEVPRTPQPLWVGSNTQLSEGLVYAVDFRANVQPWVSKAPWTLRPHTRVRYLPEYDEVFLDTTYGEYVCGLDSANDLENLLFGLADFTIRYTYMKPSSAIVDYPDEIIYAFSGGTLYPTGFEIGLINGVQPYIRVVDSGGGDLKLCPLGANKDQYHEIMLVRKLSTLYFIIDGVVAHSTSFAVSFAIPQPAALGHRPATTWSFPIGDLDRDYAAFKGYVGSLEIYRGVALTIADYTKAQFPLLRQPDSNTNYLSGDGVRLVSSGPRLDNRFQLEYRRLLPDSNTTKNRYLTNGKEHLTLAAPKVAIKPGNLKIRMMVEEFSHFDPVASPIVIFGDIKTTGSGETIFYREILDINDQLVRSDSVTVPENFSIAVAPAYTALKETRLGRHRLGVTPYRTLFITVANTLIQVPLTRDFGKGYWEFELNATDGVIKADGKEVGTYTQNFPAITQQSLYGVLFAQQQYNRTIKPLLRYIVSTIELEGDFVTPQDGNLSGTELLSLTTYGELAIDSTRGSRLTIVNGDIDQWI